MKFHHVGIVVNNIADNVKIIENILQSKKTSIPFHDKIQKVNVTFLDLGNFYIELIEPNQTETPVTNFLEKHGSGIHHLGFEVEDIEKESLRFEQKGLDSTGRDIYEILKKIQNGCLYEATVYFQGDPGYA